MNKLFILLFATVILAVPSSIFAQTDTGSVPIAPLPSPTDQLPSLEPIKQPLPMPESGQMMPPRIEGQDKQGQIGPMMQDIETEEREGPRDFVDPQEIKQVLRQIKDIRREANKILKKAKKLTGVDNEIAKLNDLLSQLGNFETAVKNTMSSEDPREALQEFYDARLWEVMEGVRATIELPNELKMIEKDLKRVEKLISSKTFVVEKIDMNVVKAKIEEIKNAISEARNQLSQSNFEEAREAMQVIYEGSHPGEIMGVLNQLRDITRPIKKAKQEIKDIVYEALSPVLEAVNNGEFRDANMMLNEINRELWRLLPKIESRGKINEEVRSKMQQLEQKLQQKVQEIDLRQEQQKNIEPQSRSIERYQPHKASLIDSFRYFAEDILDFFGL